MDCPYTNYISKTFYAKQISPLSVCSIICRTAFLRLFARDIRASRGLNIAYKNIITVTNDNRMYTSTKYEIFIEKSIYI